tara:strand:+ start:107 stop:301 length:195 start_codon:yes stop_codon:yes gene_type:complete
MDTEAIKNECEHVVSCGNPVYLDEKTLVFLEKNGHVAHYFRLLYRAKTETVILAPKDNATKKDK